MPNRSRLDRFKESSLYVISCAPNVGDSYDRMTEAVCAGGAQIFQLRDTVMTVQERYAVALRVRAICASHGVLFIVNDDLALAMAVEADGVHLGQEDLPIPAAKSVIKRSGLTDFLIGCSTHALDQARKAEQEGADYIGIGPVFSTPTKPLYQAVGLDLVKTVTQNVQTPHVAIGGIDATNVNEVLSAGANRVAVVRAVCGSKNAETSARQLRSQIDAAKMTNV
jgi:thiamine-phosphate pyrophosphorylase